MNKIIFKIIVLFLVGALLMGLFSGCGVFAKKYNVTYDSEYFYENAKASYRAGTRVKLTYSIIATDTDYTFTVTCADGTPVSLEPSVFREIIFVMPEQDVSVETIARNSMSMAND